MAKKRLISQADPELDPLIQSDFSPEVIQGEAQQPARADIMPPLPEQPPQEMPQDYVEPNGVPNALVQQAQGPQQQLLGMLQNPEYKAKMDELIVKQKVHLNEVAKSGHHEEAEATEGKEEKPE